MKTKNKLPWWMRSHPELPWDDDGERDADGGPSFDWKEWAFDTAREQAVAGDDHGAAVTLRIYDILEQAVARGRDRGGRPTVAKGSKPTNLDLTEAFMLARRAAGDKGRVPSLLLAARAAGINIKGITAATMRKRLERRQKKTRQNPST